MRYMGKILLPTQPTKMRKKSFSCQELAYECNELTEWICRRYLEKQKQIPVEIIDRMRTAQVYKSCQKELAFLESLAFHGMKSAVILLGPDVQETAEEESGCFLFDHPDLLNIGMLNPNTQDGVGTRLAGNKDYYFIHLSFQEYFAARYILNALHHADPRRAIELIQQQKYNQWFQLVFMFLSGLLSETRDKEGITMFWYTILAEPFDLVGIRHIQLTISCLDEAGSNASFLHRAGLLNSIAGCIKASFNAKQGSIRDSLKWTLRSCSVIPNEEIVQIVLADLLQEKRTASVSAVLSFVSFLQITEPNPSLLNSINRYIRHTHSSVRRMAFNALTKMGEKAATSEVISGLVSALHDQDSNVRGRTCHVLGKMGQKAATSQVISGLMSALRDQNSYVRSTACNALVELGEKATTSEFVSGVVRALDDEDFDVRSSACDALIALHEKAATREVISALLRTVGDKDFNVRKSACDALVRMGEKSATTEVLSGLLRILGDEDFHVRNTASDGIAKIGKKVVTSEVISGLIRFIHHQDSNVRRSACDALSKIGEKAATNEVISGLVSALGDKDSGVRSSACYVLMEMGEKAATSEVINGLVGALRDQVADVRKSACDALGKIGEKAATSEVINGLVGALRNEVADVRKSACDALSKIGEKAATNEVLSGLGSALRDEVADVRRSACDALGKMVEKAATSEVINGLVGAVFDKDSVVRRSACHALGKMGEKAATSEVISGLVSAVSDKDLIVRRSACDALVGMGDKATTNSVISRLLGAVVDEDSDVGRNAWEALLKMSEQAATSKWMLGVVSAVRDALDRSEGLHKKQVMVYVFVLYALAVFHDRDVIAAEAVVTAERCFETRSVSNARLVKLFLDTRESMWLPVIVRAAVLSGSAVTTVGDTIWIYERQEVVKISVTGQDVLMEFRKEFENYSREIGLEVGKAGSVAQ